MKATNCIVTLKENDLLKNTCMFFAQMNENPVQRSLIGISATAAAEYFRDEQHKDILFFADNMFRYIQARNELSTILDQVPNEGGYEPTIFSDVKSSTGPLKFQRKRLDYLRADHLRAGRRRFRPSRAVYSARNGLDHRAVP